MPNNIVDLWSGDAFSLMSMTKAINDVDHIPDRSGQLVFADASVTKPVNTLTITIERVGETLKLLPTMSRGAPATMETGAKRKLYGFRIPHIPTRDTIYADSVQNVREFGSSDVMMTVESKLTQVLTKMSQRLDFTLENHRLGALKGQITDADGSVLLDLYEAFEYLNSDGIAAPEVFDFDLGNLATDSVEVRIKCQNVFRFMNRIAKTPIPNDGHVWAFCGDNFFDALISRPDVKDAFIHTADAQAVLGGNYAYGVFEYGGIFFENYRGSDDGTTISVPTDEARFFWSGVPSLYAEAFAPADYMETVNTPGLPKYAKSAPDRFGKSVDIEAQMNPLPLCLNPATLCKAVKSSASA
jgi:hypothetical protein